MPVCAPIKDMRDTAAFSALVHESPEPVVVTKNGYADIVAMRPSDYDALKMQEAKCELLERMLVAEKEIASGKCVDAYDAVAQIEAKYGL